MGPDDVDRVYFEFLVGCEPGPGVPPLPDLARALHLVEIPAVERSSLLLLGVVVHEADDPLARRCLGRGVGNHRNDLGETPGVAKIENKQRTTKAGVVAVALDEAGHQHVAAEVDDRELAAGGHD